MLYYYVIVVEYKNKCDRFYKCLNKKHKQTNDALSYNSYDLNTFLSMIVLDMLSYGQNFMSTCVKPSV